ncbi:PREDICTED: zinc finger CCCH domain-containing protein 13-like isoform X1 [Polistes dominula]|uniref:Zinc finger CCCH domain-containing protein 13-like isoform X1 n=1 Tax=Polistes dominula TaxID=743375 RepID=A0ABM1IIR9_POLDO|nr:PREDICTED: zinc finger CCCH domain-containing protein 13-like isoform X1 [Polistes dominula]XP_015180108.1 PREDICTED: zinc finger CCCH domain-containing protein 13-like isoform X1 [Polistes dominula]
MPPKKSNLSNARSKEARRKRIQRAQLSAEQITARNAAQRARTAEHRANESQEQREERLRQTRERSRAVREQNLARARARERARERARARERQIKRTKLSLKRASFARLASNYASDIDYSAHSKITIGAMDKPQQRVAGSASSNEMFQNENNSEADEEKPTDATEFKVPKLQQFHSVFIVSDMRDDFSESPSISMPKESLLQTRLATLHAELEELRQRRQQQEIEIANIENKKQRFQEILDNLLTQEMQKAQEIQDLEMEYK